MPPPLFLDPARLDFSNVLADRTAIERVNPHRHEFALLDAVIHIDSEQHVFAGYHDVRADAFWARGHIPGRPLFPGVLMIEAAGQLASYLYHYTFPGSPFLGFVGADQFKFRGIVEPPARLVLLGCGLQIKPRRVICGVQGLVGDKLVFEGQITGMPV
jgi:3-hydroxyacyl-[acyl-carrier-protein] dehydratase